MKITRYDSSGMKHNYEGEPIDIHPYDMCELLSGTRVGEVSILPAQIIVVDGKLYNQTTEIPAKTTRFA